MPDPLGDFSFTWPFYAAALLGYLLGSIPFGLVLPWLLGYGDIRKIGSGNIGTTNVLRTGNKPLTAAVLLLDGGKGAIAVGLGWIFGPDMAVLAGGGAVLGHCFPVWLWFKGGKGVATSLGTLLAITWPVGALACLTWIAVAFAFRYSSLAALAALALSPVYAWLLSTVPIGGAYYAIFIAVVVYLRHIGNIRRLIAGRESKIGEKGRGSAENA
jgi:glycerol-3-phosphate acyltransferase PlsY